MRPSGATSFSCLNSGPGSAGDACTSTEGDTLLLNRNAPPAFRVLRTEFSETAEREGRAVIPQLDRVHDLYFGGNLEASFAFRMPRSAP